LPALFLKKNYQNLFVCRSKKYFNKQPVNFFILEYVAETELRSKIKFLTWQNKICLKNMLQI